MRLGLRVLPNRPHWSSRTPGVGVTPRSRIQPRDPRIYTYAIHCKLRQRAACVMHLGKGRIHYR